MKGERGRRGEGGREEGGVKGVRGRRGEGGERKEG